MGTILKALKTASGDVSEVIVRCLEDQPAGGTAAAVLTAPRPDGCSSPEDTVNHAAEQPAAAPAHAGLVSVSGRLNRLRRRVSGIGLLGLGTQFSGDRRG